jgi:N-acetylmuramoyl-L-alanine amidase
VAVQIVDHRLVGEGVTWQPDEQGGELVPEIVVVHYAVTLTARSTAAVLDARDYVSCHVSIGAGQVIQQVPLNRVAWHAGKSSYQGRDDVNGFSLGIEISNPGPLIKRGDQFFPTWPHAKPWTGGVVEAWHKDDPKRQGWHYWAEFSELDVDTVIHLCELFRQECGIRDIVGHDEIAPGRKFDPGPAFPINAVRAAVFPGAT